MEMKKPTFMCLLVSLVLIVPLLGASKAAGAAVEKAPYGALKAGGVCACCPQTCGGGTFIGCYNTIDMPPNAVTCVYSNSGGGPGCVSCLNATLDTTEAALNAIFEEAKPGAGRNVKKQAACGIPLHFS
jgi:hypothetical protein